MMDSSLAFLQPRACQALGVPCLQLGGGSSYSSQVTHKARQTQRSHLSAACLALLVASGSHKLLPRKVRRSTTVRCSAIATTETDNVALVFIKPHANTPKVLEFVPSFLEEHSIKVLRRGSVSSEDIEAKGIIDAHYASIAKIGMARDTEAFGLGEAEALKFEKGYGRTLDDVIRENRLCSAVTAMEILGVDPSELLRQCLAAGYEKLRSGLYCARLTDSSGHEIYVLNGFYARMREKFTAPGITVNWFVVSFKESQLPWSDFRSKIIGATNPPDAIAGSLRARIRDDWNLLGLKEETNYQDNGVHASAGPLEALRERMVWIGENPEDDVFGSMISSASSIDLRKLVDNPIVVLADGKKGSAFDLLEDKGVQATLEALSKAQLA